MGLRTYRIACLGFCLVAARPFGSGTCLVTAHLLPSVMVNSEPRALLPAGIVASGGPSLCTELFIACRPRRVLFQVLFMAIFAALLPATPASAEGLLEFLFGGLQKLQAPPQQASSYADPLTSQRNAPTERSVRFPRFSGTGESGPGFCVRTCDGKYFPLTGGRASPVQMCQALCPASETKVYFGSNIESAYASTGERYAESKNAFAYRKALRSDCTCNGRDPTGLAPVDLAADNSLRAGDIIATTDGLVVYTGARTGDEQTAEFTPIASYSGLNAEMRARLNEMKIAPVRAEPVVVNAPMPGIGRDGGPATTAALKAPSPRSARRAVD